MNDEKQICIIDEWLKQPPFAQRKNDEKAFVSEIAKIIVKQSQYSPAINRWFNPAKQETLMLEDLPFLPVHVFKKTTLVTTNLENIIDVRESSSTSSKIPSCVNRDATTLKHYKISRNAVLSDFCTPKKHLQIAIIHDPAKNPNPRLSANLVVDVIAKRFKLGITEYLVEGEGLNIKVDVDRFLTLVKEKSDDIGLIFGHTAYIYLFLIDQLKQRDIKLDLKSAVLLFGWGWKNFKNRSVSDATFRKDITSYLGIPNQQILDMYGFAESNTLYLECEHGWRHVPQWERIVVRDPVTLMPVKDGQEGLLQFISPLAHSYPGTSLLIDDIGVKRKNTVCDCGRYGAAFKVIRRANEEEVATMENLTNEFIKLCEK